MGESRRPHPMQTGEKLIARHERDKEIVSLKRRGLTYREISEQTGVPIGTCRDAFMAAVREAAADRFTETALYVVEHMEQLGALLDAMWDKALAGDDKAVAEARRLIMAMADLDGSKAPIRHEFGESDVDRLLREAVEEFRRRAERSDRQDPRVQARPGPDS